MKFCLVRLFDKVRWRDRLRQTDSMVISEAYNFFFMKRITLKTILHEVFINRQPH
jgi:alpha/beta superfamily hydrolase